MILSDRHIRELCTGNTSTGMITPFYGAQRTAGKISYGLSSYGYDARVDTIWKVFKGDMGMGDPVIVDPKKFDERCYEEYEADTCLIPPHSFVLARTMEQFKIPRNVLAICLGKSTYARCGVIVNVTPLEPEWRGKVTLEISNTTPLPAKIYGGEGICQFLFFRGIDPEISYADRQGKYQDQEEITLPRMK